jgi:transposase
VAGQRDPKVLAQPARQRLRGKLGLLEEAFHGHFSDHHAFLLQTMLDRIDRTSADIAALEAKIEAEIAPFRAAVDRLDEITGVGRAAARIIIAEIGLDMGRFPTPGHLVSWARFAPGVKQSAGKKKGTASTGHGNPYLAPALGEAAVPRARPTPCWASATGAAQRRQAGRGGGRPLHPGDRLAPAGRPDRPLPRPWPRLLQCPHRRDRKKRNHVHQLEALGYKVTLNPPPDQPTVWTRLRCAPPGAAASLPTVDFRI